MAMAMAMSMPMHQCVYRFQCLIIAQVADDMYNTDSG